MNVADKKNEASANGPSAESSATLARFAAELKFEDIPAPVLRRAEDLFLDWLASALAGKGARPVEAIERFALAMGPAMPHDSGAEVLISRRATSAYFAAMVNAAASHYVEQDDVHNGSVFHPATVVFPPALALAQTLGKSGKDFLLAVVAGYEVGIRVGEFLGRSHYRIFHTTGTAGTLAAGAIAEDSVATGMGGNQTDDSAAASGAVYVFSRIANRWTQQAYLKSGNSEAGDLFGYGVSLSADGTALAVAAYDEDGGGTGVDPAHDNASSGTGAIYAFSRQGATWTQTGYLKGSRSQRNDALGYAVAISDDGRTIAGGTAEESCLNGGINPSNCDIDTFPESLAAGSAGAAYVWVRNGDRWVEQAFIKAAHPDLEDWFAVRLALSGDGNALLVGAPMEDSVARGVNGREDDESAGDSGAAFLFTRSGAAWSQRAYLKASNADEFDEFGSSVAISGDGRTMVVGARMESGGARTVNGNQNDNDAGQSGAAYLFGLGQ
mgnify:CR=1 FL=1